MGFTSKTCAKTHKPIVNIYKGFPALHTIAALTPDGKILTGPYDGYGRVNDEDILDWTKASARDWDKIKFVLLSNYAGEKYQDLGPSKTELAQGYFMSNQFLIFCMQRESFKNYAEYKKYFKKLAGWL